MRIGLNGGGGVDSIDRARREARRASHANLSSYWLSVVFGVDPFVTMAAISRDAPGIDFGVAVVPTYSRHPITLAAQALTAQQATGSRLLLGIGPSHQLSVEAFYGGSYSKPYTHTKQYLRALQQLMTGEITDLPGDQVTARGKLSITAPPPTILIGALGTRMLELAGAEADGAVTWMVGPKTLRHHTVPTVVDAADAAWRPAPRIVAGLNVCVTDDAPAARLSAAPKLASYGTLPAYRAMFEREGVDNPEDLLIAGPEDEVLAALDDLADAGVTDVRISVVAPDPEAESRTLGLLAPAS